MAIKNADAFVLTSWISTRFGNNNPKFLISNEKPSSVVTKVQVYKTQFWNLSRNPQATFHNDLLRVWANVYLLFTSIVKEHQSVHIFLPIESLKVEWTLETFIELAPSNEDESPMPRVWRSTCRATFNPTSTPDSDEWEPPLLHLFSARLLSIDNPTSFFSILEWMKGWFITKTQEMTRHRSVKGHDLWLCRQDYNRWGVVKDFISNVSVWYSLVKILLECPGNMKDNHVFIVWSFSTISKSSGLAPEIVQVSVPLAVSSAG